MWFLSENAVKAWILYFIRTADCSSKAQGQHSIILPTATRHRFRIIPNIKSVIVSEGVTGIGERLFQYCDNLKTVSLPTTLTAIKKAAFLPHIDGYIYHQSLNGLTELKIPERVTELGVNAFAGTAIKSVTVPSSVVTVGAMAFSECQYLETVRYGGKVISDRMFVRCTKLKNLTLTRNVKEIVGGCFNYCESLTTITYEGSLAELERCEEKYKLGQPCS